MTVYVAFLRGVNVGGNTLKMADVKQTFEDTGFTDVRTILASGNVVFTSDRTDRAKLKKDIESALRKAFGYDAWIVLLDVETVGNIIADFPFEAERDGWHNYVLLSSDDSAIADLLKFADDLDPMMEQIEGGDGVLYWAVERGYTLTSKFGKETAKKKYKSATTNRNLRTLQKIVR